MALFMHKFESREHLKKGDFVVADAGETLFLQG
jgi:hypothetical protein